MAAGLAAAMPDNEVDMMIGIGGAPEAVITAAGVKCFGGDFQGILKPHDENFAEQARQMGLTDLDRVFTMEELARGNAMQFVATGVVSGPFLQGVICSKGKVTTHSLVMRLR